MIQPLQEPENIPLLLLCIQSSTYSDYSLYRRWLLIVLFWTSRHISVNFWIPLLLICIQGLNSDLIFFVSRAHLDDGNIFTDLECSRYWVSFIIGFQLSRRSNVRGNNEQSDLWEGRLVTQRKRCAKLTEQPTVVVNAKLHRNCSLSIISGKIRLERLEESRNIPKTSVKDQDQDHDNAHDSRMTKTIIVLGDAFSYLNRLHNFVRLFSYQDHANVAIRRSIEKKNTLKYRGN